MIYQSNTLKSFFRQVSSRGTGLFNNRNFIIITHTGKKKTYVDKAADAHPNMPSAQKYAYVTKAAVCRNKLEIHQPGLKMSTEKTLSKLPGRDAMGGL